MKFFEMLKAIRQIRKHKTGCYISNDFVIMTTEVFNQYQKLVPKRNWRFDVKK